MEHLECSCVRDKLKTNIYKIVFTISLFTLRKIYLSQRDEWRFHRGLKDNRRPHHGHSNHIAWTLHLLYRFLLHLLSMDTVSTFYTHLFLHFRESICLPLKNNHSFSNYTYYLQFSYNGVLLLTSSFAALTEQLLSRDPFNCNEKSKDVIYA